MTNFEPLQERTLLRRSLRRSRDVVLVPTSPGYLMFWPTMVMLVLLWSDFSGRNVQTTFEKVMPFRHSRGVLSLRIAWKVLVPFTHCLAVSVGSTPMPRHRRRPNWPLQTTNKRDQHLPRYLLQQHPPGPTKRNSFLNSCLHISS